MESEAELEIGKHKRFFQYCMNLFPRSYTQLDTSKLTLLFFNLSGLDLIGALDMLSAVEKQNVIDWIYSMQITTRDAQSPRRCGFRGGKSLGVAESSRCHAFDSGHLAMTYTGMACLLILGDDMHRLDRLGILAGVKSCQLPNGSFCCVPDDGEHDMRFVFCAAAVCHMLGDWRAIDLQALLDYVKACLNYDGAFGQAPGCESHGGSTFCAVAALQLSDRLHDRSVLSAAQLERLKRWCAMRLRCGFHGRPEKPDDSCYSFWIGATLLLLGALHCVDRDSAVRFTLSAQDLRLGGFGKWPDSLPDSLHSYLSLAGLSILGVHGLAPLDPALNVSCRAAHNLTSLRSRGDLSTRCCAE